MQELDDEGRPSGALPFGVTTLKCVLKAALFVPYRRELLKDRIQTCIAESISCIDCEVADVRLV